MIAGVALLARGGQASASDRIGLFTTLPILWNEAADVGAQLKSAEAPHWARKVLADRGGIAPLDSLAAPGSRGPLDPIKRLVMAQPRPLGPAENVTLDTWVRGGGRLLLLADPALTEDSRFAIGDPRRPQAVVLLSPILKRWGLELQFDESQTFGDHPVGVAGVAVPVNLAGRFVIHDHQACHSEADGLIAECRIGRGQVTAVADAALLDRDDPDGTRAAAFSALIERAFKD